MKALSIRQPWARLIVLGWKDIENRTWPIGHRQNDPTQLPIRIYVHASKTLAKYPNCYNDLEEIAHGDHDLLACLVNLMGFKFCLDLGAVIGEVDIADCVKTSESQWFEGPYGFVLANPTVYREPIPCKGKLGFFKPEISFKRVEAEK